MYDQLFCCFRTAQRFDPCQYQTTWKIVTGRFCEGVLAAANKIIKIGERVMLAAVNNFLKYVDDLVWGVPLIVAILLTGIYLTNSSERYPNHKTSKSTQVHV